MQGPERSGSSFHKDPNSTSAWNGVVTGAKKWILYPPHITPPGVQPISHSLPAFHNLGIQVQEGLSNGWDPNGGLWSCQAGWETSLQISQQFIADSSLHVAGVVASEDGADVATPVSLIEWFLNFHAQTQEGRVKPRECVVKAGELLFVPRGWWHMALNLEANLLSSTATQFSSIIPIHFTSVQVIGCRAMSE